VDATETLKAAGYSRIGIASSSLQDSTAALMASQSFAVGSESLVSIAERGQRSRDTKILLAFCCSFSNQESPLKTLDCNRWALASQMDGTHKVKYITHLAWSGNQSISHGNGLLTYLKCLEVISIAKAISCRLVKTGNAFETGCGEARCQAELTLNLDAQFGLILLSDCATRGHLQAEATKELKTTDSARTQSQSFLR